MKSKSFNEIDKFSDIKSRELDTRFYREKREAVMVNGCVSSKTVLEEIDPRKKFDGLMVDDFNISNLLEVGADLSKVVKASAPSTLKVFDSLMDLNDELNIE